MGLGTGAKAEEIKLKNRQTEKVMEEKAKGYMTMTWYRLDVTNAQLGMSKRDDTVSQNLHGLTIVE